MSFHASAQNIHLDGSVIRATFFNSEGGEVDAEVDLNEFIGNNNGSFEWAGQGFADSAENISLSFESDQNFPILRAELRNVDGDLVGADINLAERLGNDEGRFVFVNATRGVVLACAAASGVILGRRWW